MFCLSVFLFCSDRDFSFASAAAAELASAFAAACSSSEFCRYAMGFCCANMFVVFFASTLLHTGDGLCIPPLLLFVF